jgi:hypothetical protein
MTITYNGDVTFYGKWSLTVISKSASFQERVRISGSLASDGPVAGIAGQQVAAIDGASWDAYMEWSSDNGVTWYPSRIHRLPGVTPQNGFVVQLRADDNFPNLADNDFNDLVVQFIYLNPQVNPAPDYPPPFSFTLPAGSFYPQSPAPKEPEHCCCCCGKRRCTCRRCNASTYRRQ